MPRNYYVSGEWNVICDSCGKKIKAEDAKQRWDGLIVCPADFEMRQPQDFVKARADKITVPFTRPIPTNTFIYTEGFFDTVSIIDDCGSINYIDPLSGYFLEDYMIDNCTLTIVMDWNLTFTDTVGSITDSIKIEYDVSPTDSITLTELVSAGNQIERSLADTTSITDSGGSILIADYIDSTYFLGNDYVGSIYTF